MKVFVIFQRREDAKPEAFQELVGPEDKHAFGLYREDIIREVYSRDDGNGAIAVLECENVDTARRLMADLPMVKAGLLDLDIFGALPYRGIAQLAE